MLCCCLHKNALTSVATPTPAGSHQARTQAKGDVAVVSLGLGTAAAAGVLSVSKTSRVQMLVCEVHFALAGWDAGMKLRAVLR